jgi:hypothetical protein
VVIILLGLLAQAPAIFGTNIVANLGPGNVTGVQNHALNYLGESIEGAIIYTGVPLVENFDGMGTTGTNTPPGWWVGWTGPGVTFASNVVVSTGSTVPNQAAGWNFGAAGFTDRALGIMATASGTPLPPGTNRFIEVRIKNGTTSPMVAIEVHYDGEEWRTGSSSSQANANLLLFSVDGTNYVNMGADFQFEQRVFTPVSSALDGNAAANRTTNIGGTYTLPAPVLPDGIIYLRWFDLNDPSTDPGLAMDNFSFSSSPNAILEQPPTQAVEPGASVTLKITGTGPEPFTYQWQKDGADLTNAGGHLMGATTAALSISDLQSADLGVYTVWLSNAYGAIMSAPATLYFPAPAFHWVRGAGAAGTANDLGDAIAVDGATALYVSGFFESGADFGTTNIATPAGPGIFLARYTAAGALEWVRTGTSASGGGDSHAVAVDPVGNCYLTGSFTGTTSFGTTNVTSAGGSDVFVAKYDRSGALLWVVQQGGGFDDSGRGIAVDGTNGCFVTGLRQSSSSATSRDIIIAKYSATGALQWQRQPAGSSSDAGMAAASDASGNVYITGWITGQVNFGATNLTALGARDIFIAKYNNAGVLLWASNFGGANGDEGKGVGVDTNGNVYVTGSFNIGSGGGSDAEKLLLTKFSTTGAWVWQRELLATFNYYSFSSATDPAGNTWVVGGVEGAGTLNGVPLASTGGYDGVVAKYNAAGSLVWISQAGGLGGAIGHRVAADAGGNVYFTGEYDGSARFGSNSITSHGGSDVFVARLGSERPVPPQLAICQTNNRAGINLAGAPGSLVQIEAADQVTAGGWTTVTNVILSGCALRWNDTDASNRKQRFYRARLLP